MDKSSFILFLLVAVIGFGAYLVFSMAIPLLGSNPLIAIATFTGIAIGMWFLMQYVMNMNKNRA